MNWQDVFSNAISEAMKTAEETKVDDVTEEEPVGSTPVKTRQREKAEAAERVARQFIRRYSQ